MRDREDGDLRWDGTYHVATTVEETWWTIEVGIPLEQMGVQVISPGTTWGFNLARIRHGGADMGEYGEWAPTYGRAHSSDHFGFLLFD